MHAIENRLDIGTYKYEDTGCTMFDKCLNCPFPQCREDDPYAFTQYNLIRRHKDLILDIRKLENTLSPNDLTNKLAQDYNITTRTVFRIRQKLSSTWDSEIVNLILSINQDK